MTEKQIRKEMREVVDYVVELCTPDGIGEDERGALRRISGMVYMILHEHRLDVAPPGPPAEVIPFPTKAR